MLNPSRRDVATAVLVERAIEIGEDGDQELAIQMLTAHGLPDNVIARVLCDPGRRRNATGHGSGSTKLPDDL